MLIIYVKFIVINLLYIQKKIDHHDYTSLKVNYKINKKSNYDKTKKRPFLSITFNEKQNRPVNRSSVCTDNAKFLSFLNDYERKTYLIKNRKRFNEKKIKKLQTNIKKREKYDTAETLNNYIVNIDEDNKYEENLPSEKIPKIDTTPRKHFPFPMKTDTCMFDYKKDRDDIQKLKSEERLKNYATLVEEQKKFLRDKSKSKDIEKHKKKKCFLLPKKKLRKRKEKIIIFLNHNSSAYKNGPFNDRSFL